MGSSERNSQPEKAGGYVGTKIVTKRLKDGTIKRYRYYQLMRTYRKGGKGRTEYLEYLGKDPHRYQHQHRHRCNSQPESGSSSESEPRHSVIANRDEGQRKDSSLLPLDVIANQDRAQAKRSPDVDVLANRDRAPAPLDSLPLDVLANQARGDGVTANTQKTGTSRDPPPSLDLEVIEPEGGGLWSFPRYRATCRRCGERFEMIKFEVELGHYLCPRCRVEIINCGERALWPGY